MNEWRKKQQRNETYTDEERHKKKILEEYYTNPLCISCKSLHFTITFLDHSSQFDILCNIFGNRVNYVTKSEIYLSMDVSWILNGNFA